jgi:uncharacterized coiled-coil protein SlyX
LCNWKKIQHEVPVTYRVDDDFDDESTKPPERRLGLSIVVVAALTATGVAAGFLWRNYGNDLPAFPTFSSVNGPPLQSVDKLAGLGELQALQQQSAGQLQTVLQILTSQQAEIKKLSEQVTTLAGKVDILQHSVTAAQVVPTPPVVKPAAPPARKKPAIANPIATNPTGAAPVLITPPAPNRP